MNEDKDHKIYGSDLIYFLSWHDALERLDTLILEIRHLQTSILSQLREPAFYLLLRYEEQYLWGTNWLDSNKDHLIKSPLEEIINLWILNFPAVSDVGKSRGHCNRQMEPKSIDEELAERLEQIWISSIWNRDQRRHYHVLWGLQQLKRKIFKDKLFLCRFALNLKIYQRSEIKASESSEKAKLLIVRAGVLRNTAQYILLLRDFQNAFNKSMDTGVQDHLRPSIERRRELGIYMDYLSERSKDILRDMTLLLHDMGATKQYSFTETIFHRWRHHFTSTTELLNIDYTSKFSKDEFIPSSVRFVNTSYYMPERPDLQPVIAHEVAHALIKDRMDNLDGVSLAAADTNDKFSDLIAQIQRTLSNFYRWDRLPKADMSVAELSREIACDLLAASVKGFSYVYALFLEVAGMDTERLLTGRSLDKIIDLSNVDEIQGAPPTTALSRDWLLRIKITTYWLQKCHHLPKGNLGSLLLSGIDQTLNDLNEYLDSLIVHADQSRGLMWRILINRLCEVIEGSDAIESVQIWRKRRSEDDIVYPSSLDDEKKKKKGLRQLPRSMARLHKDVRDKLFYMQLNTKSQAGRPLFSVPIADKEQIFKDYYGVIPLDNRFAYCDPEKEANTLFRHLYDIPWQAGLMRAMDVLGSKNLNLNFSLKKTDDIIQQLHNSFPLGRAFFSYALEFYSWSSEPAIFRLSHAVDIVAKIIPNLGQILQNESNTEQKEKIEKVKLDLEKWKGNKNTLINHRIIEGLSSKSRDQLFSFIDEFTAYSILHAYQNITPLNSRIYRSCERIAGLKLIRLCNILQVNETISKNYDELIVFLSIHSAETEGQISGKQKFIEIMTASLANCEPGKMKEGKLNTATLSRIAFYRPYPTDQNNQIYKQLQNKGKKPHKSQINYPDNFNSQKSIHHIWPVLGRYDYIMIGEARPICRCPLPHFSLSDENKIGTKEELFLPFFARQEMALFGRFTNTASFNSIEEYFCNNEPIAFFAITLQKRQYRLDFIYRLIQSIDIKNTKETGLRNATKETIKATDAYFLTDGWGDLVIVFSNKNNEILDTNRLENIFKFQKCISQDFMVDRTDLILTSRSFNCALKNNLTTNQLNWYLSLQIRLIESRVTNKAKDEFIEYFEHQKKNDNDCKNILLWADIKLLFAPGKDDFIIEVLPKNKVIQKKDHPSYGLVENREFEIIRTFIHPTYFDRIDTIVARYHSI